MARPRIYSDLLKFSTLGLEMGASVVIGLLLGTYLDKHFDSEPWLTILFLGLGFAAAGRAVAKAIKMGISEEKEGDGD